MTTELSTAPQLQVERWLNTDTPISLDDLRGRVVFIEAFQMLCPGCVSHGLPQAVRVSQTFRREDVVVLGLHSVFEHHAAQGSDDALAAFLHEYGIRFPVAMDKASPNGPVPLTMADYRLRGTPSTILIDPQGVLRGRYFGRLDDMVVGAEIMSLLKSDPLDLADDAGETAAEHSAGCDADGCRISSA